MVSVNDVRRGGGGSWVGAMPHNGSVHLQGTGGFADPNKTFHTVLLIFDAKVLAHPYRRQKKRRRKDEKKRRRKEEKKRSREEETKRRGEEEKKRRREEEKKTR